MSIRWKVLLAITLTVAASVWLVAWLVTSTITRMFEERDKRRASAVVTQFRKDFEQRGEELMQRVKAIAASQSVIAMNGQADFAPFVNDAEQLANEQRLNFLELLSPDTVIITSAHWPARFGYRQEWIRMRAWHQSGPFLRFEELAEGRSLGLFAVRKTATSDPAAFVWVVGGFRLDDEFLKTLAAQQDGMQVSWKREQIAPDSTITDIPLRDLDGRALATIYVGQSQSELREIRSTIRWTAWWVGAAGVALGALLSLWASMRVTRPLQDLAASVQKVAQGEWETRAELRSQDEVGRLARDFNLMTEQLVDQKRRMLQAERVAAWREIARRLAHELKNPLFPLQITIENLRRVRETKPEQFEEVFEECTRTLLAELDQLKLIIGRFSDFARMPAPRFEPTDLNEVVRELTRLQMSDSVQVKTQLVEPLPPAHADPDQLKRAIRNLTLNAMDALPEGGVVTIRTLEANGRVCVEVSDSGKGLTEEECERLFTPYYTTKQHGTGLGLAIVQSVVSDHKGTIKVESAPGQGTTFRMELNRYEQATARG
jgi:two-component system, NtrC family, nitrogen regulation sensor histidine kinase NtrY